MQRLSFIFYILISLSTFCNAQRSAEDRWVDSQYATMSDTQRIGQLFMIRAKSNAGSDHVGEILYYIRRYHIGSLCFFQGTPEKQAELTNRYQAASQIPLLIAMDAEWGLNMRLKDAAIAYPRQMMLGAIEDNKWLYQFGATVGKELKRVGVHINFAPAIDVNNNPKNPVINERSFGEDKYNVAAKGYQYMQGMQDNGVIACAKHFPGHGDTDVDSHFELPVILHDRSRLDAIELMPFRVLNQHGVNSVMVSHLNIPTIDNTHNMPASLSKKAITDLLRNEIGFDGLIFSDGLDMKGLTKHYSNRAIALKSLEAGNDILCLPDNLPDAFEAIMTGIQEGKVDTLNLAKSVKRILHSKYKMGLVITPSPIELFNIREDINSYNSKTLKRHLIENALTLVRNEGATLPFKNYQPDSMATVSVGATRLTAFQSAFNNFGVYNHFNLPNVFTEGKKAEMLQYLSKKMIVIVGLHDMKQTARHDFGITAIQKAFIQELAQVTKVVLVVFGNPYSLKYFDDIPNLVCAYDEDKMTQELAAQGLFGAFEFKGKLPITASDKAKGGMGYNSLKIKHLEWHIEKPEAVGMNGKTLEKIDAIAEELIAARAAPSCQILVAKDGHVVYHKAFGYHTYDKTQAATTDDLYDLASITKCAATTISLMKLYEEGKIDLNEKASTYLPILRGSDKEDILIRDILIHQAGFVSWIPFYKNIMAMSRYNGKTHQFPSPKWFASTLSSDYPIEVAKNLYIKAEYVDSILKEIIQTPLRDNKNYLYSDLGMILMTYLIKNVSGKTLDIYAHDVFYVPLSMSRTLFNPLHKFDESNITPTEEDGYFRMRPIRGHVHDMASAMLGGVSGHAGLFSTARDLAILLQMLLNKGEYAGIRYLNPETISLFTSRQGGSSRRGYGWDMKELNAAKNPNMSDKASAHTFGHTGFTGNAFYADPDHNLIYIFLSNRTYPDMNNNKLINGEYRKKVQDVIYEAIN